MTRVRNGEVVAASADPVFGGQRCRDLGPGVAGEDLRRGQVAGTKNAAHDGFAHGAAADHPKSMVGFQDTHGRITTRSASKVKSPKQ